jgi:hypothetical protein
MPRKLSALLNRPAFELLWAGPVWAALGVSRVLLKVIPFAKLAPWLGRHTATDHAIFTLPQEQQARARAIGRTVQFAARHTPWLSTCFTQVIVARCLLQLYRVPYAIYFGLERDAEGLKAHAWITAGDVSVTGGLGFDRYVVVGCFTGGLKPMMSPTGSHKTTQ